MQVIGMKQCIGASEVSARLVWLRFVDPAIILYFCYKLPGLVLATLILATCLHAIGGHWQPKFPITQS